jgi:hypothetical protein
MVCVFLYTSSYTKRNKIPLPQTNILFVNLLAIHTDASSIEYISGTWGHAGRTEPFSLFTLLPFELTLPLSFTLAALLSLLPGERSHHQDENINLIPIYDQAFTESTVSLKSHRITFHPCAKQVLAIIYFPCYLFILFWQDTLLFHCHLNHIGKQL